MPPPLINGRISAIILTRIAILKWNIYTDVSKKNVNEDKIEKKLGYKLKYLRHWWYVWKCVPIHWECPKFKVQFKRGFSSYNSPHCNYLEGAGQGVLREIHLRFLFRQPKSDCICIFRYILNQTEFS